MMMRMTSKIRYLWAELHSAPVAGDADLTAEVEHVKVCVRVRLDDVCNRLGQGIWPVCLLLHSQGRSNMSNPKHLLLTVDEVVTHDSKQRSEERCVWIRRSWSADNMQDLFAVITAVKLGCERPHLSGRQRHSASLRRQRVQQLPDERRVPDQEHARIQPCTNNHYSVAKPLVQ